MGYRVGLDDFGAGAASINYLHAFQVDFVKFDGAMIKKIGSSKRDDALLAGLAKLCGEMGVTTIAEWIESEAMAKAAREMGFHHGQGKWLGRRCWNCPPPGTRVRSGGERGVAGERSVATAHGRPVDDFERRTPRAWASGRRLLQRTPSKRDARPGCPQSVRQTGLT